MDVHFIKDSVEDLSVPAKIQDQVYCIRPFVEWNGLSLTTAFERSSLPPFNI